MSGRFWTGIYLIFIWWPVLGFLRGPDRPGPLAAALVVAGVAAFCGLYLRVAWTALRRPHRNATPVSLAALYGTTAALALPLGKDWMFLSSFFVLVAVICSLPPRGTAIGVGAVIGGLVAGLALTGGSLAADWWIPLQALLFAGTLHNHLRLRRANEELAAARARGERLAVDNERLRFARALHDILGHSLSVMTLKSQLARRLVDADPERARAEMEQVEELARRAMAEVRDAVAGYRALSLEEELAGARRALAAAGVRVQVDAGPVPQEAASLLAWVVREGTTNVVRHSGARECRIRCGVAGDRAFVEVADGGPGGERDGRRSAPLAERDGGHGLRGLAERLEAAGGTLRGTPLPDGGFMLRAWLPVAETAGTGPR